LPTAGLALAVSLPGQPKLDRFVNFNAAKWI
jgi:hypothetical protein